jgi:hypothetical protein
VAGALQLRVEACGLAASVSSGLTAVDAQDLAGDEAGAVEVDDRVGDVSDLAGPADGVESAMPS